MADQPQHVQVLGMLRAGEVCGTDFIKAYLPNFPRQIHRLRHIMCCPGGVKPRCRAQAGHDIRLRRCERREHQHKNPAFLYRLIPPTYGPSEAARDTAEDARFLERGPQHEPHHPELPLVRPIVEKVTDEFQALIDKHGPAKAAAIHAGLDK